MKKRDLKELILCISLGWLGVHKFYKKKNGLGVLYLLTFGLFGIGWIFDIYTLLKKPTNSKNCHHATHTLNKSSNDTSYDSSKAFDRETITTNITLADQAEKLKKENPEEFKRKHDLCQTIYDEYASLSKTINETDDIYQKIYILKECYRKLSVISSIHNKTGCFVDVFVDEEKIEKKAISVLNKYIKDERENDMFDYEIDILQFVDDLDFISEWIYNKDEKLSSI